MRVAVVGTGYWGRNLVRVFADMGVLGAICDLNQIEVAKLAEQHRTSSRTYEAILKDDSINAIAISTPAIEHAAVALRALEAGKHVFIEKPMALRIEDAEILLQESKSRGLILMVGHLLQYHPAFGKVKHMITDGEIGEPQYFYSNRLNLGRFRREEDILWSFAPHDISMILSLAGEEPSSVLSIGSSYLSPSIADVTLTHLEFSSGVRGHIFVSWLHPFKEQRLVAIGGEGMITFDDGLPASEKVKLYRHKIDWKGLTPVSVKSEGENVQVDESEPLRLELQHFCDCVDTGASPITNGEEGMRVLRVLRRATESMLQGSTIQ